jgi:hypothetical protein
MKMKTSLIVASFALALTPGVFAEEPNPATAAQSVTNAAVLPEDLADQAALVQQIGAEAARGFDPEAHAKALRQQIEALLASPTKAALPIAASPSSGAPRSAKAALADAGSGTNQPSSTQQAAIQEAVQKIRAALGELEARLSADGHLARAEGKK